MSVGTFMTGLWTGFKTQEEVAILKPLAVAASNYASNPTAVNFLAQFGLALAQIEAAQPAILQAELAAISGVLQQAASAVATPKA
jgi:hypothetical protein